MKGAKLVIKFGGNRLKKTLKSQKCFRRMSDSKENQKEPKSYQKSLKILKNYQRILQRDPGDFLRPSKPPNQAFGLVRSFE